MPKISITSPSALQPAHRRSYAARSRHSLAVALVLALLAIAGAPFHSAAQATEASGSRPKAVIIVGPAGGSTSSYLSVGSRLADQAAAAGMEVRRIFHPKATDERVLANIQGAKYVVYLGHGNGWPSPYGPFQERTKNGFGLNPYEGAPPGKHVYRGANWIRANVRLAEHAVVMLVGACYASGNGESGMPIPTEDVARQRVDNYAAGFLYAGASVVYAFGWQQRADYAQLLMNSNKSFDEIFMTPSNGSPSGYIGWRNRYHASQRTPGARNHLDPHRSSGYYRAASGYLSTTANQWRASAGSDDSQTAASQLGPPTVPTGLAAEALGYRYVRLTWNASTASRAGDIRYRIFRNGTRIATVKTLEYVDRPSTAGTYRYKIRAVDSAGYKSDFTPIVEGRAVKGPI